MYTLAEDQDRKDGYAVGFEILTEPRVFEALKRDWDALYDRAVQPYFSQSFSWCWTSWQTVSQPRGRKLHCVVGRQDNRVVLIWPFVVHRLALWLVARPLGPETTEYSGVLVEDSPDAMTRVAAAWQELRKTFDGDVILLPYVQVGSILHKTLSTAPLTIVTDHARISSVSWDRRLKTWEDYCRSLNGEERRDLNRRVRRLAERGNVKTELTLEGDRCAFVINWIIAHKEMWLDRKDRGNAWLRTAEYRDFLIAATGSAQSGAHVPVSALILDDTIIAALVSRVDRFRVEPFLATFDRAYHKFAPGQILFDACLRWAFEHRLEYDFRIGDEPYKKYWANRNGNVLTYEAANSVWGTVYIVCFLITNLLRSAYRIRLLLPAPWRQKVKAALKGGRTLSR